MLLPTETKFNKVHVLDIPRDKRVLTLEEAEQTSKILRFTDKYIYENNLPAVIFFIALLGSIIVGSIAALIAGLALLFMFLSFSTHHPFSDLNLDIFLWSLSAAGVSGAYALIYDFFERFSVHDCYGDIHEREAYRKKFVVKHRRRIAPASEKTPMANETYYGDDVWDRFKVKVDFNDAKDQQEIIIQRMVFVAEDETPGIWSSYKNIQSNEIEYPIYLEQHKIDRFDELSKLLFPKLSSSNHISCCVDKNDVEQLSEKGVLARELCDLLEEESYLKLCKKRNIKAEELQEKEMFNKYLEDKQKDKVEQQKIADYLTKALN